MAETRVGLDTSVVLRLLIGEPEAQAQKAEKFLDSLLKAGRRPAVSDLVVAETYFALQFHYDVPKKEALRVLREFFESGEIESPGKAAEVLNAQRLSSSKPGFVDRLIHAEYLSNGGSMATFEKASKNLAGVKVIR